jgi:BirA family biotin operon repressor/biotin-[acetyl-CoA-carboxylase] ligase
MPLEPPISWNIQHHSELNSTNDFAREQVLARWGAAHSAQGLVVVADRQLHGRGQHGRAWESPAGGLYFSAVVEDGAVRPEHRSKLALIAGVAAADALETAALRLRWPNDLMLNGKKVGGILCESLAMAERWAGIIGVGINVTTPPEAFSPKLREAATSLARAQSKTLEPQALLNAILGQLARHLELSWDEGLSHVLQRVRELDSLSGHTLEVESDQGRVTGIAAGIDEAGRLLLNVAGREMPMEVATVVTIDGVALRAS